MDKLHFDDLTKITCPPGMLDDDTLTRLQAHKGKLEFWNAGQWMETDTRPSKMNDGCIHTYRAAPVPLTKPNPPWEFLADWVKYVAKDSNGKLWGFSSLPNRAVEFWWGGSKMENLTAFKIDPGTCGWKDSLVQRPE